MTKASFVFVKISNLALSPGGSISYTVGVGGAGVTGTSNGNDGGDTSFNTSSVIAKGGQRGFQSDHTGGGQGGQASASTGTVKYDG